ncbi:MAG: hypothetical protein AB7O52_04205 [Planctomycetota bacterium]
MLDRFELRRPNRGARAQLASAGSKPDSAKRRRERALIGLVTAVVLGGLLESGPVAGADPTRANDRVDFVADASEGQAFLAGAALGVGADGFDAALRWIADSAHASGLIPVRGSVEVIDHRRVGHGDLEVTCGRLWVDGVLVDRGPVRVVTRVGTDGARVVAAGCVRARPPAHSVEGSSLDASAAVACARRAVADAGLTEWDTLPRLVAFDPRVVGARGEPCWAWRVTGWDERRSCARIVFIDAVQGTVKHTQDGLHRIEVDGLLLGHATPGALPDTPSNPALQDSIRGGRLRAGAALEFAGQDGSFELDLPPGAVDLIADLTGAWCVVTSAQGAPLQVVQTVTPPATLDLVLNDPPHEFATAQINAFLHVTGSHDFFRDRQPAFTAIDQPLAAEVNAPGGCSAFYDGVTGPPRLVFARAGNGCRNCAYRSIVAHEYGHFVLDEHGLPAGGPFGEGFADTFAVLQHDDPRIGPDLHGNGASLRDVSAASVLYPCVASPYICSQVLAGFWWDLRVRLTATLGVDALAYTQQLFTDWAQITVGASSGLFGNSATPVTVLEVLTVDDDDGDLGNGTPHAAEICAAFAARGLACPAGYERFQRGDCSGDGSVDLVDPIRLLGWLFGGQSTPACARACDADADGSLTIADAVLLLQALFLGSPLPPPALDCGIDFGGTSLDCNAGACRP